MGMMMNKNQLFSVEILLPLVEALAPQEGQNSMPSKDVTLFRTSKPEPPMPVLYSSSIVITVQGRKKVFLGEKVYQYDPQHYLLVTSQMPMLCEVQAENEKPVLTMRVDLDLPLLSELVMEMTSIAPEYKSSPLGKGVSNGDITPQMVQTLHRLLECLADPTQSQLFARSIIRELYFHILNGPNGHALRSLAHDPRYGRLNDVVLHINKHYADPMRVDDLAEMASMSIATFHHNFKALTSASPLQYLKSIRLSKARLLMLHEGMGVGQAANAVGYESASQFSREFQRFFGEAPVRMKSSGVH